ncbi:MAG: hypothetical protein BWY39_01677 [Spirochaetes bacterium ADurb.Bin269]|nr:MAG: hypothetical protein BWY39_01677 [Spirochaetes bacterium ADurb.Bin269]
MCGKKCTTHKDQTVPAVSCGTNGKERCFLVPLALTAYGRLKSTAAALAYIHRRYPPSAPIAAAILRSAAPNPLSPTAFDALANKNTAPAAPAALAATAPLPPPIPARTGRATKRKSVHFLCTVPVRASSAEAGRAQAKKRAQRAYKQKGTMTCLCHGAFGFGPDCLPLTGVSSLRSVRR